MNTTNPPEVLTTAQVLAEEREEVESQRKVRFSDQKQKPKENEDHVGLCFSGGGIRSATLNLGILQGLRETGVLKQVDYLSTVSGGGYIGSWFCALRYRLAQKKEDATASALLEGDAFLEEYAARETADGEKKSLGSPPLRHLRQYARYLAPKAGITSGDVWTMVSIWLRNTFLVQLMVISVLFFLIALFQMLPALFQYQVKDVPEWQSLLLQLGVLLVLFSMLWCEMGRAMQSQKPKLNGQAKSKSFITKCYDRCPPPVLLTLSMLAAAVMGGSHIYKTYADGIPSAWEGKPLWASSLVAAFLSVLLIFRTVTREKNTGKEEKWDKLGWKKVTFWLGGTGLQCIAVMAVAWLLAEAFEMLAEACKADAIEKAALKDKEHLSAEALSWASIISLPMLMMGYGATQVLALGIMGRYSSQKALEWLARAGAWLIMASLALGAAAAIAIAGPVWVDYLFSDQVSSWLKVSVIGGWSASTLTTVLAGKSDKTRSPNSGGPMEKVLAWLPLLVLLGLLLGLSWLVRFTFIKQLEPLPLGTDGFAKLPFGHSGFLLSYFENGEGFPTLWLLITLASGMVALLLSALVNLNEFSMNLFYRNRLVRCYLGSSRMHHMRADERNPHSATDFDFDDDLPLSNMLTGNLSNFPGPLQIINTALNTGSSAGMDTQERSAESFAFTPLHAGFQFARNSMPAAMRDPIPKVAHRAYSATKSYGGGWTLGQALSVSGAAASPNSGYHTSPLVAFMLTLFNARLGWWAPNPGGGHPGNDRPHGALGFLRYLAQEATGSASLSDDFVYLSDGGHFENLGLYELVRRGCSVIIVGDGECDPEHTFHALGTAIRRCKVDFGVVIDIDTSDLLPNPSTGLCSSHVAFGTIWYPEDFPMKRPPDPKDNSRPKKGILIYLKSSMTGDESLAVKQYRSNNAIFPHESTGDQFFSESQFESYRELGLHIAIKSFHPITDLHRKEETEDFHTWMKRLHKYWTPPPRISSASFVNHSVQLTAIWRETQRDPGLAGFDTIVMPAWSELHRICTGLPANPHAERSVAGKLSLAVEPARKAAYLCQEILQLMENVYLDLDLHHAAGHEDHRGWMALFRYWAAQPVIQQAWKLTAHTFGERFENFCKEVLEMQASLEETSTPPPESQLS